MMNNINTGLKKFVPIKNKEITFRCPSCGKECKLTDNECPYCGFSLTYYKTLVYSYFRHYNNAIDFVNKGEYNKAYSEISKYLSFSPNDMEAEKLNLFIIFKLNYIDLYDDEMDNFIDKYPMNQWAMQMETNGMDTFSIPEKKDLNFQCKDLSLEDLTNYFINPNLNNLNEIVDLTINLYDVISFYKRVGKLEELEKLENFYEKIFKVYLAKKEISIEESNNKLFSDLSNDDLELVDVINRKEDNTLPNGTLVTVSPLIKVRNMVLRKEKVIEIISDNSCLNQKENESISIKPITEASHKRKTEPLKHRKSVLVRYKTKRYMIRHISKN